MNSRTDLTWPLHGVYRRRLLKAPEEEWTILSASSTMAAFRTTAQLTTPGVVLKSTDVFAGTGNRKNDQSVPLIGRCHAAQHKWPSTSQTSPPNPLTRSHTSISSSHRQTLILTTPVLQPSSPASNSLLEMPMRTLAQLCPLSCVRQPVLQLTSIPSPTTLAPSNPKSLKSKLKYRDYSWRAER